MGHPHRPHTRYILPNGTYVIIYDDKPEMKIGVLDADFEVTDDSACKDRSRIVLTIHERGEARRRPRVRGRDVVVSASAGRVSTVDDPDSVEPELDDPDGVLPGT